MFDVPAPEVGSFSPSESVLWIGRLCDVVPVGFEALGEQFENCARFRLQKRPPEPAEAGAAQAQHLRAVLEPWVGLEAAHRFCCTADLGATALLLQTRHGRFHSFPGAAEQQNQVFQRSRVELAAQIQE